MEDEENLKKNRRFDQEFCNAYSDALKKVMYKMFLTKCETDRQVFDCRIRQTKKECRGFFVRMGNELNISTQTAKDYYNNTWIREDQKLYVRELVSCNPCLTNKQLHDIIAQNYPQYTFNRQMVNQYLSLVKQTICPKQYREECKMRHRRQTRVKEEPVPITRQGTQECDVQKIIEQLNDMFNTINEQQTSNNLIQ